jgi:hypothetical protein
MTQDYRGSLLKATERLMWEDIASDLSAGQVIAAVARAKVRARNGYVGSHQAPPPPDEYAALVFGLARRELASRVSC